MLTPNVLKRAGAHPRRKLLICTSESWWIGTKAMDDRIDQDVPPVTGSAIFRTPVVRLDSPTQRSFPCAWPPRPFRGSSCLLPLVPLPPTEQRAGVRSESGAAFSAHPG